MKLDVVEVLPDEYTQMGPVCVQGLVTVSISPDGEPWPPYYLEESSSVNKGTPLNKDVEYSDFQKTHQHFVIDIARSNWRRKGFPVQLWIKAKAP